MPVDFRDAAERHFKDAAYLHDDNRLANADHLYGLAGECALKAVMIGLGMKMDSRGIPEIQKHMPTLAVEFGAFVTKKNATRYATRLRASHPIYGGWDISQRYDHRNGVSTVLADAHRWDATRTMLILKQAMIDGVVKQ